MWRLMCFFPPVLLFLAGMIGLICLICALMHIYDRNVAVTIEVYDRFGPRMNMPGYWLTWGVRPKRFPGKHVTTTRITTWDMSQFDPFCFTRPKDVSGAFHPPQLLFVTELLPRNTSRTCKTRKGKPETATKDQSWKWLETGDRHMTLPPTSPGSPLVFFRSTRPQYQDPHTPHKYLIQLIRQDFKLTKPIPKPIPAPCWR